MPSCRRRLIKLKYERARGREKGDEEPTGTKTMLTQREGERECSLSTLGASILKWIKFQQVINFVLKNETGIM